MYVVAEVVYLDAFKSEVNLTLFCFHLVRDCVVAFYEVMSEIMDFSVGDEEFLAAR